MKTYHIQYGIGRSKYVAIFHDGVKTHKDGSPFFDVDIFRNKPDLNAFVATLKQQGFVEKDTMKQTQDTAEPPAKVSHTAGPWRVLSPSEHAPTHGTGNKRGTDWRDIVTDGLPFSPSYVGEALAQDATLIAAAPELLHALRATLRWTGALPPSQSSDLPNFTEAEAVALARAAIAKATRGAQ